MGVCGSFCQGGRMTCGKGAPQPTPGWVVGYRPGQEMQEMGQKGGMAGWFPNHLLLTLVIQGVTSFEPAFLPQNN